MHKTAFPPNFVHSLDSSHMMMTAVACGKAGITFAGWFFLASILFAAFFFLSGFTLITIYCHSMQEFMTPTGHMHVMWMYWTEFCERSLWNYTRLQYWRMYGFFRLEFSHQFFCQTDFLTLLVESNLCSASQKHGHLSTKRSYPSLFCVTVIGELWKIFPWIRFPSLARTRRLWSRGSVRLTLFL